ncbi:MAG: S8 family peptidase [Chloroflexi bacterium]|nr:S8 family peptidase [Chloroflexota bacterium]
MRGKSSRLIYAISAVLATALTLTPASYIFAQAAAQEGRVNVLMSFDVTPGPTEEALVHNAGGNIKRSYHIVPAVAASIPRDRLESLRRNPKVTSIEEDVSLQVVEQTLPRAVDRIDAGVAHGQSNGRGVKVAILDTGIDLDHPDLRVVGRVSFVDGATSADDDHGHGTMVAGVVGALDNGTGVTGVAPEAQLYAVKVLNKWGWGYSSDILAGIEWAIDHRMQVVNMSFGGPLEQSSVIQAALEAAYQAGIVLVAAAGNAGDQGIIYSPARYQPVIAVGATDQQGVRASFSSTGPELELMAPGVDILTTARGGGYVSGSGTSLSAPHISGAAASLIASGVTSNAEVRRILQVTAEDLGLPGWDEYYGWGLASAARAASYADNDKPGDWMPPTTDIEIVGVQSATGWYHSDVTVELTAEDNPGGSGVAMTEYSMDSGQTWHTYQGPFIISQEGRFVVQARSRDNAGNVQTPPASVQANIDKTGPAVTISVSPSIITAAGDRRGAMADVLVTVSVNDGLSEAYSLLLVIKDEYGQIELVERASGSYLQKQVQLEAWADGKDLDGRVYSFAVQATDSAENTGVARAEVVVSHDYREGELTKGKEGKR